MIDERKIKRADKNSSKRMYFILSLEWDKEKNGPIPPRSRIQDIAFKEVSWKCSMCGREWEDTISNRLRGEKPCSCGSNVNLDDEFDRFRF